MFSKLIHKAITRHNSHAIVKHYASATSISDQAQFPGYKGDFTTNLEFIYPETTPTITCYRVMNRKGGIIAEQNDPKLDKNLLIKMYKTMSLLHQMDTIMYESQRQGRISFYLTSFGETAAQIGSAAALNNKDLVYAQYRESGVLMWRGFTIDDCLNQILGNVKGSCKGKQMPIHYGSKEHSYVTISSPLATQMPQAVGSAYAYKRAQNGLCCIVYFGDGASSEGDAHTAMNFAAVFETPVIFFCRNNGYAISTPTREQFRGDGIASRGAGYGITTIRVDGNDLFAVYNATKAAREIAVKESRPVLIEAMTYRIGHHSTSDDSTAYRSIDEINSWEKEDNPMLRFRNYLINHSLWDMTLDEQCHKESRQLILNSVRKAEQIKKANPTEMFNDVYAELTPHLRQQRKEMLEHVEKYKDKYPLGEHERIPENLQ